MGLRTQLFLVALITLLLPWAGCQYVKEMEGVLRESQRDALQKQAQLMAKMLTPALGSHHDGIKHPVFYSPIRYQPVQMDGYGDDWQSHPTTQISDNPGITLQKAIYDDRLYLFLQVQTSEIRYSHPGQPFNYSDHLLLITQSPNAKKTWLLFTSGPGQLSVFSTQSNKENLIPAGDTEAWWQETHNGFNLEISLPTDQLLSAFDLEFLQQQQSGIPAQVVFSSRRQQSSTWINPLPEFTPWLTPLRKDHTDAIVINPQGWPLSEQKDWLAQSVSDSATLDPNGLFKQGISRLYRFLIDSLIPHDSQTPFPLPTSPLSEEQSRILVENLTLSPEHRLANWYQIPNSQQSLLMVVEPLGPASSPHAFLILTETSEALITLTNGPLRTVTHRSLVAVIIVIAVLILFASSLSWRIRRLKKTAEQAISSDGKVHTFSASTHADEIGDLSRSYHHLLQRVHNYTEYLETLNGKLAHELRTPLAIVKSSLELIESTPSSEVYLARAEEGIERLRGILSAMSEASRVEQLIQHSDFAPFDLTALISALGQAYQDTYTDCIFQQQMPDHTMPLHGSAELMAQLMDKLIDNARSFSTPNSPITLSLTDNAQGYCISVANLGPILPPQLTGQLFDSLVSSRTPQHNDKTPHLGLGLFIVRLIAEAHGGKARACNLAHNQGVEFSVVLPKAQNSVP